MPLGDLTNEGGIGLKAVCVISQIRRSEFLPFLQGGNASGVCGFCDFCSIIRLNGALLILVVANESIADDLFEAF